MSSEAARDDLDSAAQLFGWALTIWSIGCAGIALIGHARAEHVLVENGIPGAHWIVSTVLVGLAALMLYGRLRDSRKTLVIAGIYGALFCVADAVLVIPMLLNQNAGLEIANWGLNFLLFMLSAVVNNRRKGEMTDDDDKLQDDSFPLYARVLGWILEHVFGKGKNKTEGPVEDDDDDDKVPNWLKDVDDDYDERRI